MVLRTAIKKLTVQALEVLAIRWNHLQMLVPRRDRPLAQVPRHTIDLRELAVLHRTLLSRSVVMYPEAVGFVLVVELHVKVVLVLM